MPDLTHAYCFIPGTHAGKPPLVLLHRSGGNEQALMPLTGDLARGTARLGIRGTVAIDGDCAFFERFPDRRVNEADVAARASVLADFIQATCHRQGFDRRPIAISFSNGAIVAATLLLTHLDLLAAAVLFRPLAPFTNDLPHRLNGTPVLITEGGHGRPQLARQWLTVSGAVDACWGSSDVLCAAG